ncbi:MAG TPA: hypothetical protein P5346_12860 [Spirochaetota bacterium]|nr:hypothetical protein [Spirochaetota bacterium]HSA15625.1 hypothetical protein [Spirochaetota bacterium]
MLKQTIREIRDRIAGLNPGQRRVLFGTVFFLLVNAVILTAGIILISRLLKKL